MNEDPLEALSRDPELARLSQRMRDELRSEAEEYEALAAKDLARGRRLADAVLLHCHRGDVVEVTTSSATFVGRITYCAGDLACMLTETAEVDVWINGVLSVRVVERAHRGGWGLSAGPASFKARLFEHEAGGGPVSIGTRLPDGEIEGRIAAVAVDHLVVEVAGPETRYLALAAVEYLRRPRS